MTFTPAGSLISATASTFSLTPGTVGDLICLEVIQAFDVPTKYASALSSSNVTWTFIAKYEGSTFEGSAALFTGKVTSTSTATVTVTWTGGTPGDAIVVAGHEYSSSVGSWAVDVFGHIDSAGTNTWASLTPGAGAGELYFGYAYSGSASAGSTSGYTYAIDSDGDCCAWNAACTSSAQAPQTGDSAESLGMMMLVKELTLAVTTTSLPAAATGIAYSQTLAASSGTTPYTWSISSGALPSWASLNSSTGAITGTPGTGQGGATFTVEVTDSASHTATQSLTLAVLLPVTLVGSVGSASGTSSPLTAVYGQSPTAGNLLLALISAGSTTAETPAISTSATGWSRLGSGTIGNNSSGTGRVEVDAWVKAAVGGDAAPTFTQTLSGSPELACYVLELNGANLATPLDVSGVYQSGSSTGTVTFTLAATPGNYGEFAADIMAMERATGTFAWTETGSGWTSGGKLPSGGAVISTQANYRAAPAPLSSLTDAGHFGTDSTAYGAGLIVVIAGAPVIAGAAVLAGSGSLTAAGVLAASASLSGSGTLTAAGSVSGGTTVSGTATLTGSGTLAGGAVLAGSAPLSGSGSLGAGAVTLGYSAPLSGTGTLTAAGVLAGTSGLAGSGTLGAGNVVLGYPAALAGSGSLTAAGAFAGASAMSGSGALTAGNVTLGYSAALTGTGSLGASGVLAGGAALTGSGTLGEQVTTGYPAALAGAGILAAGQVTLGYAAALAGSGSLTASGVLAAAAALSGSGTLSAAPALGYQASLSGSGSLTAASGGGPLSPVPVAATNGQQTTGATAITVTLPSYTTGDFILLIVSTNNAQTSLSFSAAISSAAPLPSGGSGPGRLWAVQLTPDGTGQTTFTVTGTTSSVWSWWCANYRGASTSLAVDNGTDPTGNSTVAAVAMPEVELGYIATGNEVMISAAGTNSTATWTTDANTQFHTAANSAALMVDAVNLAAGVLTGVPASMNRGLSGTSRNQNSLALVLQVAPGGIINLLSNPSFESGSTIATGWTDEHTTATEATYSIVSSGVTDGTTAQQFAYSGVSADGGTAKTELYQAPISATPGQYLTFSVWLSGSFTNAYGFIGIEGFTSGSVYISEADTNVLTLTSSPVQYTVSYLCPAGTDHVAAYIQCPEIGPTSVLSVTMDQAELTAGTAPTTAALSGSGSLDAAGVFAGSAGLSGSGSLGAGNIVLGYPASLDGEGTLAAAGAFAGAASLSGSGTISVPGVVLGFSAALSGSGSLTASASASGNFQGTAALSGSGTLTAAGVLAGTVTLSGTGALTAAWALYIPATGTLSGSGTLAAAGVLAGTATLSGSGALTASWKLGASVTLAGSGTLTGSAASAASAALSGSGTLGTAWTVILPAAGTLNGSGTLTGAGDFGGAAILTGSGTLAAQVTLRVLAVLSGTGTLTGDPSFITGASALLTGTGTLTGAWQVIAPVPFTGTWTASPLPPRWQASLLVSRWKTAPCPPRWQAEPLPPRWKTDPLPSRWKVTAVQFDPISALSVEYVNVNWTSELAGTETDPTGATAGQPQLVVQFAVPISSGNPLAPAEPADWFSAVWLTGTNIRGYVAQACVGPTGGSPAGLVQLTAGLSYDLYSKILGSGEAPVKFAGVLPVI